MLLNYDSDFFDTGTQANTAISNVPAPNSSVPNWLAIGQTIENDIIYGYRAFTQPQVNPNMVGATISGGAAGTQVSISPIFLVALIAIVYLVANR